MLRVLLLATSLLLSACASNGYKQPRLPQTPPASAVWEVGPILDGVNKSINAAIVGNVIDIPHPTVLSGHVHYVTFNPGDLVGKSSLTLRIRVEYEEGTELRAASPPEPP